MSDWQPIATCPRDRPVEIATFPLLAGTHVPNMMLGDVRECYPNATEAYTTQVCSSCGVMPEGRPKGIADLRIRQWECVGCGASHDRDVNAAINIARAGLRTLAEGAL